MENNQADFHEQFLRLFTANESAVRAYVRLLVPTRADAEDVMQEIALVLWRKFEQLKDKDNFRNWAFGVARFETLSWLRDKARDRHVLANDLLEVVASEALRDEARLTSQREALEGCLGRLPEKNRSLILAAYAPNTQIQQVAEKSGRTVGAFYQWLHRIRRLLLECTRRTLQAEGAR